MGKLFKIDENVILKISKYTNVKKFTLYNNFEEIDLFQIEEANYTVTSVAYDKNYIVIYKENKMIDGDSFTICCVYDVKNNKFINFKNDNELITDIKYTYLKKHEIDLKVILSIINVSKLKNVDDGAIESAIKYLSADDNTITKRDIIYYIFKTYPKLFEYRFVDPCISKHELKKIAKAIGGEKLAFFKILHTLKESNKDNIKNNRELQESLDNFNPFNDEKLRNIVSSKESSNSFSFDFIYKDAPNRDEEYNDVIFEKKLDRLNLDNTKRV